MSLGDILPALSLITGTSTTDNIDSGRNPCEVKLVKHIPSKGTSTLDAYFKFSEQISSDPRALFKSRFSIACVTSSIETTSSPYGVSQPYSRECSILLLTQFSNLEKNYSPKFYNLYSTRYTLNTSGQWGLVHTLRLEYNLHHLHYKEYKSCLYKH